MAKILDLIGLEKAMSLQKEYIDKGDQKVRSSLEEYIKNKDKSVDFNKLLTSSYKMADIDQKGTSPGFLDIFTNGDLDILDEWDPVLIRTDLTEEVDGHTVVRCTKLQKNNLFRYADPENKGRFAPVVGITKEQYNECMVQDLYVNIGGEYKLAFRAGKFDPIKFWEKSKAYIIKGNGPIKLYDSNRKEVNHILRPWETTDTNYTIGIANHRTLYLLDNQKGENGYWRGISTKPIKFDGIDIEYYALPPTAISPGPTVDIKVDGKFKARNFFYLYKLDDHTEPAVDDREKLSFYDRNRTYPSVEQDLTTISEAARNNNKDTSNTYPFAPGGYLANNMFITALELAVGNRYIFSPELFGSGISSNESPDDTDTYLNKQTDFFVLGGLRFQDSKGTWKYYGFDSIDENDLIEKPVNSLLGYLRKKWEECLVREQCMESQMAASMATELGIKPTTDPVKPKFFEFYGNKYYYMNVPGVKGLMEGMMNARVYKYVKKAVDESEFNIDNTSIPVELVFRMSLFNGVNLCGDVPVYRPGGLEIVNNLNDYDVTVLDVYVQPDQTLWDTDLRKEVSFGEQFIFEDINGSIPYKKIGTFECPDKLSICVASRVGYTPIAEEEGRRINHRECYRQDYSEYKVEFLSRVRLLAALGGSSVDTGCSPRNLMIEESVKPGTARAGSLQALVKFNYND